MNEADWKKIVLTFPFTTSYALVFSCMNDSKVLKL